MPVPFRANHGLLMDLTMQNAMPLQTVLHNGQLMYVAGSNSRKVDEGQEKEVMPLRERLPIPSPVARFNLREIQINAVGRHAKRFVQEVADLLRQLPVHICA